MDNHSRWIELEGAVNVRDLGGLPTSDGRTTRFGRVLRSDNLQGLTASDVRRLTGELALRDVVDLRSEAEVRLEGPGPLTRAPEVRTHHLSLFAEGGHHTDVAADVAADVGVDVDKVLPWQVRPSEGPEADRSVEHYLGYLRDRPDSIVGSLRVIAAGRGAVVHCAAGKDRTGVVCALALEVAGVTREATLADYTQTGQRLPALLRRLRSSDTYAADLDNRPADSHMPHAYILEKFLATVDEHFGGTLEWLAQHGWRRSDSVRLRSTLLD